jgi:uncharacterized protein (TIGR02145 family)
MKTNIPKFLIFLVMTGIGLTLLTSCKKTTVESSTEVPLPAGQVKDASGNIYHTVTIGTQTWMVENLKTTKFRNGDAIPQEMTTAWGTLTSAAYCDYGNLPKNAEDYGHLYNWYAVNDSRQLAPKGWHVATDAEWITLATSVGGVNNAGPRLKEQGTVHWSAPSNGTDNVGFKALPAGFRAPNGTYAALTIGSIWWTTTEGTSGTALNRIIDSTNLLLSVDSSPKAYGFAVRCIKD